VLQEKSIIFALDFQSKVFQNSQFSILETQTLNFFRKKFLFEPNTFTFEYV